MRGIDLFSGGGCGSAGARHAGLTMVAAADAWDIATKTYQANFEEAKVINARLTDRSGPELFGDLGKIDMLIASPECTHHSIARGNRPVDEESRRSGWYVMNFIKKLDPRWIVLENVTPMQHWPGFDDLIAELKRTYKIRIEPLDAADYGTPQNRRRLFIMGDKLGTPSIVKPILRTERSASSILDRAGTYAAEPVYNGKRAASTIARVERGIAELGRKKDFLIVYYGSDRAGGWQRLDRPLRTLTTLDRFGLVQWIDNEPTLRMLQVPELKRAMGLTHLKDHRGEGVKFELDHGTRRDKIKVLGNGVCAPVMRAVVGSLLGGGSDDLLEEDLHDRPRRSSGGRHRKKRVRH
ncbi:DNA cytosine methyltransferase [Bradyrhizobium elkanii]|uniref:DNA cytosine methyltransferase n=1 Tax=Bradyrhizobium elkanii TaxID=29448 RepID=UPI003517E027